MTAGAVRSGRRSRSSLSAEPFAEALVETGLPLGIDEFLLVQWLAPLASEAPEFVVVVLFAWRGRQPAALGTLVSSKVNQWTLLVGDAAAGLQRGAGPARRAPARRPPARRSPADGAQSLFAVVLLLDLRLSLIGAGALFGLFALQMLLPDTRGAVTIAYFVLTAVALVVSRRQVMRAFRWVRT